MKVNDSSTNLNNFTLSPVKGIINEKYKKGEAIRFESQPCLYVIKVESGSIIAKQSFKDGHDSVVRILKPGDYIGLNLIFSSQPSYKASFYALKDTSIKLISKKDLLALMQNDSKILKEVLRLISDFGINLNEHIKLLNHKSIKSKLAYLLIQAMKENKANSFTLPYNKTELAALLNVERPSLSKELNQLIKDGIISEEKNKYTILKPSLLKDYIND